MPSIPWIAGCLLPVIIGALAALTHTYLLSKRTLLHTLAIAPITIGTSTVLAVTIYYTIWGGFGPGVMLSILAVAGAVLFFLSAVVCVVIAIFRWPLWMPDYRRRAVTSLLVAGVLIPFSLLAPVGGTVIIGNECDKWDQQTGNILVSALEAYKHDSGIYPQEIETLIPKYIPSLPSSRCSTPIRWILRLFNVRQGSDYWLRRCSDTVTLLIVSQATGGWGQRYNLATGTWTSVDFLEGECSFLE